ncbi:MAG: cupin domain-containing protein [Woeseia sp.]
MNHITRVNDISENPGDASETPPELLLSGISTTRSWDAYSNARVNCGVWESEAFSKVKQHPTSLEYCFILEGEVKLTDSQGASQFFKAGDAFVVEPGFDGVWESLTKVRKHYVICEM